MPSEDPFLWLEAIDSAQSLDWVRSQNALTRKRYAESALFKRLYRSNLAILDSDQRIAFPDWRGEYVYNFWKDKAHERGIWRRASLETYLTGEPEWATALDIDGLAAAEGEAWVFKGVHWLEPAYDRCLVKLSPGGGDAVEIREFDLNTLAFVEDGFRLPVAKSSCHWIDRDTLWVGTDFGLGSLTDSGYPRVVKVWRRGTPIAAAETLIEGESADVGVWPWGIMRLDEQIHVVRRSTSFHTGKYFMLRKGELVELPLPDDCRIEALFQGQLVLSLKSDWEIDGRHFAQGALVSAELDALLHGARALHLLVAPDTRSSIDQVLAANDVLYVNRLEKIANALYAYRFEDGAWQSEKAGTPEGGSFWLGNVRYDSNDFFLTYEDFLTPSTLSFVVGRTAVAKRSRGGGMLSLDTRTVDALPRIFECASLSVSRFEATSADGTHVPYFVIHPEDWSLDGHNPTVMYGYGGFEVALKPAYLANVGVSWLELGGVYVIANIRGGGEFGPAWHRAALREKRQRAYDDFAAVAEDVIARGIASPQRLGIMGGSNGGLLVGVAFTQRPELYNAVVCAVPLLDMRRFNKLLAGASWMAEYGNPDADEDWEFISQYSPYHNLSESARYPEPLFSTSTRDDRVHPGHARKMMAKMGAMGHAALYYENIEGGHAGSSTNAQKADEIALRYAYLNEKLASQ